MSFDNKNLRCRDCKFWWPVAEGGDEPTRQYSIYGHCRRHAPPSFAADLPDHKPHYPTWCVTKRDDWCGEHVHMEMR
jgi:hypothetical protein